MARSLSQKTTHLIVGANQSLVGLQCYIISVKLGKGGALLD